jgi:hypothetical protein
MLEAIAIGASTRKYARSLEALPEGEVERSVARSSMSRRFVAMSSRTLRQWLTKPLDRLDIRVVYRSPRSGRSFPRAGVRRSLLNIRGCSLA